MSTTEEKYKKVLVTGSAGFIGFHLTKALLAEGFEVTGIDNLNDYYDPALKQARLSELDKFVHEQKRWPTYQFIKMDLADQPALSALFDDNQFDVVINLAAQAGVRYSIENPHAYVSSNLVGFVNVLEACRYSKVKHLVYASSSSVYGMNVKQPFSTDDKVDHPISLYAATKKSNELMAHTYSHLYGLPTTGLRFFTVYGPWGRPDMAYFKFTKAILEGSPIDVYNHGKMQRDFTYIDDIIEGIMGVMVKPPKVENDSKFEIMISTKAGTPKMIQNLHSEEHSNTVIQSVPNKNTNAPPPYKLYNLGNNQPVTLRHFITAIENVCGKKAIENSLPMQLGDVPITFADITEANKDFAYHPKTKIEDGIRNFYCWYEGFYS